MPEVDRATPIDDTVHASLRALGERLIGDVVLSGDDGWDSARSAWNLSVDQRPVAVVLPENAADVVATVRLAGERGLAIAFNAGGHNAGPISWDDPTILLKFERMRRHRDRSGRAPGAGRGRGPGQAAGRGGG